MNTQLLFWAKLGDATWPDSYHPVLCHLIDVGQVARRLWDNVFRPRIRSWVTARLSLGDDHATGSWLAFWAASHDIGKLSPCFQYRGAQTNALCEQLVSAGFDFSCGERPHGDISTHVLAQELESAGRRWPAVPRKVALSIAVAVGGHHGIFPTNWNDIYSLLGNACWVESRREMLAKLAQLFGVNNIAPPCPALPDDQSIWMYLAGLTSVADWIGSNQEFFKPVGNSRVFDGSFNVEDYFHKAESQAADALEKLGWLGRADTNALITFRDLFPFIKEPRPLQTAVADAVADMTEPSLLIVEAPMGEGKTEAAWYAAACWDRRGGQGSYVALPTMATSNQMFDRVQLFLERNDGKSDLQLLHGKAALNDKFAALKYRATNDPDCDLSGVVAEGWFAANKKHGLLAPYGVGTIDQALLAVLQTKHVFVRLFGLAGKCVILDEVHAYDAYMTTLMERLLRWLAALGCPVVLLSATLPRDKRLQLMRAYAGNELPAPDAVPYPRVTNVSVASNAQVRHVDADPARARTVGLGWLAEDGLVAELRQSLANGGCAAVIRNTVGLAQETYLRLRDTLKGDGITVELFHARFPFGRRMEIENAVLQRFGKNGEATERDKRVLVATQVVEQSLDLDFDLMVSDVAPVDLVLQRAGRLWRHQRTERLGRPVHEPERAPLWLIEPAIGKNHVPDFGLSGIVYSQHVLFRSLLALRAEGMGTRDSVKLPSEIDELVELVYEDLPAPDSLLSAERDFWAKTYAQQRDAIDREKGEAESRRIKKPRFTGSLARIVQEPRDEDNPGLHPAHQALTRLARPTVSLICLNRECDGVYLLPHDNGPVQTLAIRKMSQGGFEDIGRLMLGEVTSAHWGLIKHLREGPRTPPEWVDVGMLCRHHLIVFTRGKANVGEYELTLDHSLGLSIDRGSSEGEDE